MFRSSKRKLTKKQARKEKAKKAVAVKTRKANQRTRLSVEKAVLPLVHSQGKNYSLDENKTAILVYSRVKGEMSQGSKKPSKQQIIERAAFYLCRGQRGLWDVVTHFERPETKGQILDTSALKRGSLLGCVITVPIKLYFPLSSQFSVN